MGCRAECALPHTFAAAATFSRLTQPRPAAKGQRKRMREPLLWTWQLPSHSQWIARPVDAPLRVPPWLVRRAVRSSGRVTMQHSRRRAGADSVRWALRRGRQPVHVRSWLALSQSADGPLLLGGRRAFHALGHSSVGWLRSGAQVGILDTGWSSAGEHAAACASRVVRRRSGAASASERPLQMLRWSE